MNGNALSQTPTKVVADGNTLIYGFLQRSGLAAQQGTPAGQMIAGAFDRTGPRPRWLAVSKALTIRIAPWPQPIQGWSRAMISEFKELVVLPIAMILFLCAASTLPSLAWRSDPPAPIAVASR